MPKSNSEIRTSTPYFQSHFPADEFVLRREKVRQAIGSEAVAVLQGAGSTGAFDIFRQTNQFFYLTGVEVPHAYLLIDGRTGKSTLYLPPRDPKHERSEGSQLSAQDVDLVRELTGVDDVGIPALLADDLRGAQEILTPQSPGEGRQACRDTLMHARQTIAADPWDDRDSSEERFGRQLLSCCPEAQLRDLSPILDQMRVVKSCRELEAMRAAGRICALAVTEAMRCTRPGLMEYHLAAAADYIFLINGAQGGGYRPIVASGANIWNAHYFRNNCELRNGELVLMDYAPDLGYYTSDIGRMWPIGGTYSEWQRELYGYIVEYHKVLLAQIRLGVTADQVMSEAAERMRPVVEKTAWSQPEFREAAIRTLDFQGHLSHPVGMAVHDVGDYQAEPLQPGTVFALDPQMWVPERQLYIRVEDTVAVTENGCENLTSDAPLELDDVEATMRAQGIIELRPAVA